GVWVTTASDSGSFSWATAANWSNHQVPTSGVVTFAGSPGTPITVTLDGPQSAGSLLFSAAPGDGYTLTQGGGGTLTLNNSGSAATISVGSGSHALDLPASLADGLTVVGSGQVAFGATSSIAGVGPLELDGPEATLVLSGSDSYSGGTNLL